MKKTKALLGGIMAILVLFGVTGADASHDCRPLLPAAGTPAGCPPDPEPETKPQELSGCSYTAYASLTTPLTGPVVVPNVTPVNFTTASGAPATPALMAACPLYGPFTGVDELLGFSTTPPLVLGASVLRSTVDAAPSWFMGGWSHSTAQVADLTLSIPSESLTIEADLVRAVAYCTSQAKGSKPGRDDVGPPGTAPATLAGLKISHPLLPGGSVSVNGLPPEDTWIPIPGVGGIMLRETWDLEAPPHPANPYKSFTENMIHVYLSNTLISGDIVISHAHCDGYKLNGRPHSEGQPR